MGSEGIRLFVGVEGGGSSTKGILLNENAEELSFVELNQGSNHWQIGYEECVKRLLTLIDSLLVKANMTDSKLSAAGFSLSGANSENGSAQEIEKRLLSTRPDLFVEGKKPAVYNDLTAALETATDSGGVVLISGTGSNCRLTLSDGRYFNCGGWGHMLGDDGSAYWIAHRAIKTVINHVDGLRISDQNISVVQELVFKHFNVTDTMGLIQPFYTDFSKSFTASLTAKLAQSALNNDPLCVRLFEDAGIVLANQVMAVCNKVDSGAFTGGLKIVCMGSVWKSWNLLKTGFLSVVENPLCDKFGSIQLLQLRSHGCHGAAHAGARDNGIKLEIPRSSLVKVLHDSH